MESEKQTERQYGNVITNLLHTENEKRANEEHINNNNIQHQQLDEQRDTTTQKPLFFISLFT